MKSGEYVTRTVMMPSVRSGIALHTQTHGFQQTPVHKPDARNDD